MPASVSTHSESSAFSARSSRSRVRSTEPTTRPLARTDASQAADAGWAATTGWVVSHSHSSPRRAGQRRAVSAGR